MDCPECHNELGARARYCGCGWVKPANANTAPHADVPCAHMDCGIAAMCKIQTPTGWANLCWQHYDQYFAQQAKANCAAKVLHTTEKLLAAFKAQSEKLVPHLTNREFLKLRDPGEDYSEDATY